MINSYEKYNNFSEYLKDIVSIFYPVSDAKQAKEEFKTDLYQFVCDETKDVKEVKKSVDRWYDEGVVPKRKNLNLLNDFFRKSLSKLNISEEEKGHIESLINLLNNKAFILFMQKKRSLLLGKKNMSSEDGYLLQKTNMVDSEVNFVKSDENKNDETDADLRVYEVINAIPLFFFGYICNVFNKEYMHHNNNNFFFEKSKLTDIKTIKRIYYYIFCSLLICMGALFYEKKYLLFAYLSLFVMSHFIIKFIFLILNKKYCKV